MFAQTECDSTRPWHLASIQLLSGQFGKNSTTAIRFFTISRRRLVALLNLFKTQPSSSLLHFASPVASDSFVRGLRMTHKANLSHA